MAMIIFEQSGTFNPADYGLEVGDVLNIVCVGGGGSGGSGGYVKSSSGSYGDSNGGGGAGGDVRLASVVLNSIDTIAVTIGAGGASVAATTSEGYGTNGKTGGTSSFGSYVSAPGGPGGTKGYYGYSFVGNGDINVYNTDRSSCGRYGRYRSSSETAYSYGPGGGGGYVVGHTIHGGVGANESDENTRSNLGGFPGEPGVGYGAGGEGSYRANKSGAGRAGVVIVTW